MMPTQSICSHYVPTSPAVVTSPATNLDYDYAWSRSRICWAAFFLCVCFLSFWLFSLPLGRLLDMTTIWLTGLLNHTLQTLSYLVLTFPHSVFQPNLILLDNVMLGHLLHTALPYAVPLEYCQPQALKVIIEPGHEKMLYVICEQQRRRSACTSAQSDQHLCCSLLR